MNTEHWNLKKRKFNRDKLKRKIESIIRFQSVSRSSLHGNHCENHKHESIKSFSKFVTCLGGDRWARVEKNSLES